jgi:hypothetical protein
MLIRGGTSKGAYFLASDLPSSREERDALLLSIMGSPHPDQIDGIGGGHPLRSKVAIVAKSSDPGIDVDFLFAQVLLKLISSPHCWVKLSGADRLAKQGALEATVAFARSLIDAAPDRVLWGTDWPHVNLERSHDDEALFGLLAEIAPDDPSLKRLLVDNPARLYGF